MGVLVTLTDWHACLKRMIGDAVHGHLVNALAAFSVAMSVARSCHSLDIATAVPGSAALGNVRRRFERLLANDRLDTDIVYMQLCAALGNRRRGRRWVLIVDESDRDDGLRSLQILAAVKRRCLPIFAATYKPKRRGKPSMNQSLSNVMRCLHGWLDGYGLRITLLADRGLAWPGVARDCREFGWHFVLRLQAQTCFRRVGCTAYAPVSSLLDKGRSQAAVDDVEVFKKAGWLPGHITAVRTRGCKAPWYLLSDLPAGRVRVNQYCMRMWCEQTFRDEKSSGMRWRQSRVNDPTHATRLLLVIVLALWLCLLNGLNIVRRGWRRKIDCHSKALLSYFRLGLLYLQSTLTHPDMPPCCFSLEVI